jgi:DNA-binding transcriptional LysR family regulator
MTGELADIDPPPHHQFWVCDENEIRLFRFDRPADGKNIKAMEQTMKFTTTRRLLLAGIGAALLPRSLLAPSGALVEIENLRPGKFTCYPDRSPLRAGGGHRFAAETARPRLSQRHTYRRVHLLERQVGT